MTRCLLTALALCLTLVLALPLPDCAAKPRVAKTVIDASVVPRPGEPLTLRVEFDQPMDTGAKPQAELAFEGVSPQLLAEGTWNEEGTTFAFAAVPLGPNKGIGKIAVRGAKNPAGETAPVYEEPLVVGSEPILAYLEKMAQWILEHPHDFIFVEGYNNRTLLALYQITGKESYLEHARAGVHKLLKRQHEYGFWGTGYKRVYLADTGSALGLLINYYPFASDEERKQIDRSLNRYVDMMLVKGDDKGRPFVHPEGSLGVGFSAFKDGKPFQSMNKPYTISTSLTGCEVFAGLYYIHGKSEHKDIAVRAADWLLGTLNEEGEFPYIIDNYDPKRVESFGDSPNATAGYVGEGLITAWTYVDDPAVRKRMEEGIAPNIEFLLKLQRPDGSWGEPRTYDCTRGHTLVNVLVWYYENVNKDPRIAAAVRRYYSLLLDGNRKGYPTVAAKELVPSKWKVPLECVATSLAGRAFADILKPGVDCRRWKKGE